jgi:hypothetical protein
MQWTSDELLASLQKRPSPNAYRKFMDDLRNPKYKRAAMLPMAVNTETGKREMALPSIFVDMLEAAMLPGDVYQGNVSMYGEDGRTNPQVINRSADLAGMMTLGSGAIPAEANSLRMGIKAYHGSPHDFDRFDMSKIGTGEGAQAYGHGLYFADSEAVAKSYREGLSIQKGGLKFPTFEGGVDLPKYVNTLAVSGDDAASEAARQFQNFLKSEAPGSGRGIHALNFGESSVQEQLDRFASSIQSQKMQSGPEYADYYDNVLKGVDRLRNGADANQPVAGRMYEVNIDANPDDFLDWDKPFTPDDLERFAGKFDAVDPTLRRRIEDYGYMRQQQGQMPDGNDIVREIFGGIGNRQALDAQRTMKEAGIPGIKYLDAGSRGAGDGSRNYVVFDDKLISIVKKYGVAALVSAGVLSQAQGEEMKAQGYY